MILLRACLQFEYFDDGDDGVIVVNGDLRSDNVPPLPALLRHLIKDEKSDIPSQLLVKLSGGLDSKSTLHQFHRHAIRVPKRERKKNGENGDDLLITVNEFGYIITYPTPPPARTNVKSTVGSYCGSLHIGGGIAPSWLSKREEVRSTLLFYFPL